MASVSTTASPIVEDFVAKLKCRMKALDVKPRDLAAKARVGFPYLYRVLKGEQAPSLEWAAKVGKHVGLEIKVVETRNSRRSA